MVASANGIVGLRGIFLIPILSKQLGIDAYGLWTQVILFVGLASSIGGLGLNNAIARFLSGKEDREELRAGFYSSLLLALCAGTLVAFVSWLALIALTGQGEEEFSRVFSLGLWLIPLSSLDMITFSYFIARRRMKIHSALKVIQAYGEVSLIYAFVGMGMGLLGAIQGTLLIHLGITAVQILVVAMEIGISLPHFDCSRVYLAFSLPTIASMLSVWVLSFSDRYVVKLFYDDAAVGVYSAAYNLGHLVNFLLPPLVMVLNPTIYSLWSKGLKVRARDFQSRTLKIFVILSFPACFGLSYLGPAILRVLSTQEAARRGAIVVPVVAAAIVVYGISIIIARVYPLHKDTRSIGLIWGLAAGLNLAANMVLVPLMGIAGAAVATLASYASALVLILAKGGRYSGDMARFPWSASAKSLLACGAMVVVLHLIGLTMDWTLPLLLMGVAVGAAVYFALVWSLRVLTGKEMDFLREMVSGARSD